MNSQERETRVFFGHSIRHEYDDIEPLMARCKESMQAAWPDKNLVFTTGRQDWQDRMPVMGGWERWAPSVAGTLAGGEPRYHIVVVCVGVFPVGNATHIIAEKCLEAGREVYRWHEMRDVWATVIPI
jgi:hypothetical protein